MNVFFHTLTYRAAVGRIRCILTDSALRTKGLSASSHPGVSVGSLQKLGTQSSPPWSESLAAVTHNPYSKGQLD